MEDIRDEKAKKIIGIVSDDPCRAGDIVWLKGQQYSVVKDSNYISEEDAAEIEDLVPSARPGWYAIIALVD